MILIRPYSMEGETFMVECQDFQGQVILNTYSGDYPLELNKIYEGELTADGEIIVVGLHSFE